ncbi:MAG: PLP-dependent aminotransferase family protein [Herbaspirillum sp.]
MRRGEELELGLAGRPAGVSLQRWLYGELRAAILAGRIPAGRRLPSTRELSRQQGVSRGTVIAVYEQLVAEGYLAGTPGSGTRVQASLPTRPARVPRHDRLSDSERARRALSQQGKRLAASPFPTAEAGYPPRPFRPNQPDLAAFPMATWNALAHRSAKATGPAALGYGDAAGYRPLREAIAGHLRYAQRIACSADQVMILGSAHQALDLCARLLLDPGQAVLVEDPGFPAASHLFGAAGADVVGVPVDAAGLMTEPPLPIDPRLRLAYVTAAHQSPLGGTLPIERRLALLAWAEACDALIIEDDYDGEFRYTGTPLSALKSLDRAERVIYMGTFSKLLFPALRLAYLVVPEWLADPFAAALSLTSRHVALAPQRVLSRFIADGHFARHLRHMRQHYGERAELFQDACAAHLSGWLSILPITTGLDAAGILPRGSDDRAVASWLNAQGIETRPLSFYRVCHAAPPGLVLGFSAFDAPALRTGVAHMARAFESFAWPAPAAS